MEVVNVPEHNPGNTSNLSAKSSLLWCFVGTAQYIDLGRYGLINQNIVPNIETAVILVLNSFLHVF